MKIISKLPDRKHYIPLTPIKTDVWVFQDKGTPCLRIISPVANPWDAEWVVLFSFQQNKSDNSSSVNRLDLRLKRFETSRKEIIFKTPIIREVYKGSFGYTNSELPIVFTAFFQSISNGVTQKNIWINYTICKPKSTRTP